MEIVESGTTPFMISNGEDGDGDFLLMDTSGQVGIATTGPAEPLHVMSDAGYDAVQISENVGGEAWQIGVDADGDLHFEDDGEQGDHL